jgi:glyoxylase-like metal-dependent hydrolase (beta-lactamase superfamily II)
MLIFRQLFDSQSATYSYLLADAASREAVPIDPVFEKVRRDAALLAELDLHLVYTLETHVHADHVTGAAVLRQRLGSKIAVAAAAGAEEADFYLTAGDVVKLETGFFQCGPRRAIRRAALAMSLTMRVWRSPVIVFLFEEAGEPISKTVIRRRCIVPFTPKSSRFQNLPSISGARLSRFDRDKCC